MVKPGSSILAGLAVALVWSGLAAAEVSDGLVGVTCPETAGRGDTITVTAQFTNWKLNPPTPLNVTRGAVAMHIGNSAVTGPFAFTVPSGTQVPAVTFASAPCPGAPHLTCGMPNPGTLALPVTVRIPTTVRLRTMVTVGLGFFGAYQGETGRNLLRRQEGCHLEITH